MWLAAALSLRSLATLAGVPPWAGTVAATWAAALPLAGSPALETTRTT